MAGAGSAGVGWGGVGGQCACTLSPLGLALFVNHSLLLQALLAALVLVRAR